MYQGSRVLFGFFFRRDRVRLLFWITGGVLLYWATAAGVDGVYQTQAEFNRAAASLAGNSALIALAGPARALDTTGGQVAWQAGLFGEVLAALMSMFLIGRHTRAEEESGRDELIRSGVTGRYGPQAAALMIVTIANLALGAGISLALTLYGLEAAGSIALGVGAAGAGLVFMGVALLAAQVTDTTRSMYGITGVVIGVSYLLRAIGDIGNGVLSWFLPLGWGQAMQAFAGEVWWPALLFVAATALLIAAAFGVADRRDNGAGLFATQPGPARAGAGMLSEIGLARRLQRGTLIGWAIGLFLAGIAYGSAGSDVKALIGDSGVADTLAQGGGDLTDSFYATAVLMMALIGSSFAISSALRLGSEERSDKVEVLLATGLTRTRWYFSHALVMFLGTVAVLGLAGLGTGIMFAVIANDSSEIARMTGAAVAYLPAAWILGAVALALFGLLPRFASFAWLGLVFCFVIFFFAPTLDFPAWLSDISPFSHIPLLPVESFRAMPLIVLAAISFALAAAGALGFRRRDVQSG